MKKVTNIFSSSNDSKNKNNNPLRFKNYKIALPILSNRTNISNNNEEIIISKQTKKDINKLNIRRKLNDLYYFYHPWLSNSLNKNEIHSFMSNCYDITKVDAPVNDKKYIIKDSKLTNKYIREIEKNNKLSSIFQKKRCSKNKFNLDIKKINNMDAIIKRNNIFNNTHFNRNDAELLNMNENYKKFVSVYNNLNNENENSSLENTHSVSPIKHIYRNNDNYRNITFFQDIISFNNKKNFSSSLNNSCSDINNIISNDYKNNICSKESFEVDNFNNKKRKNNYRTIKIKKIIKKTKNDKNNDERLNKIKSNFLYKKNITFSSLNINNIDNNKYNNKCDNNDYYKNNANITNNENNNVNSNINNNNKHNIEKKRYYKSWRKIL
jgi:hypothetical protein